VLKLKFKQLVEHFSVFAGHVIPVPIDQVNLDEGEFTAEDAVIALPVLA